MSRPDMAAISYSAAPSFQYVPGLDGMRAASVLLVVLSHIGLRATLPGSFGVTAFFFISGFLITRQLLAEQADKGQVQLGAFYMRRLLRLYPALLVAVALGGVLFVSLGGDLSGGQVAAAVLYFTNYFALVHPYEGVPDGMFNPFAILWSLAVEEHYYLLFPALVFLTGRVRPRFVLLLCLGIVAVSAWRYHVAGACSVAVPTCLGDDHDNRILQATDTRIDSILWGAVLASLLATRAAPALLRLLQNPLALGAGGALLLASFVVRDPMFRDTTRFTVQGIGLFLAGGSALFSPRLGFVRRLLTLPPMLRLGRWSYSLYLWHPFVLMAAVWLVPSPVWQPAIEHGRPSLPWLLLGMPGVLAVSLLVAGLSYHYVEMPVVAIRRRFGSHAVRDGTPAVPARAQAGSAGLV